MKKFIYFVLLAAIFGIAGCGALDLFTTPDNQVHTQLTDTLETVSNVVGAVGGFIPGYGLIATGISALLGIIGSGILAFRTKSQGNKINTASNVIKTIVQGVNTATENYNGLKQSILTIAGGIRGDSEKNIANIFKDFEKAGASVKTVIKDLSEIQGTKIDVASAVVKAEHTV